MAQITPDSMHRPPEDLATGESVRARFRPDAAVYLRNHLILTVVGGTIAGLVLMATGNAHPWVGPVAALLAIGLRAAYLRPDAMAEDWRLTDRRLIGPGGLAIPLAGIVSARPFLDAVQVVTHSGDKHLIRYQANPAETAAHIAAAVPRVKT